MRQPAAPGNDPADFVYSDSAYKLNSLLRTSRTAKRWVIRGSRLLSRFPVLIRDTTKIVL